MATVKKKRARTPRTGLVVYRAKPDATGQAWRWRWVHENYRIGAESGEAYAGQAGCRRGFADFLADLKQNGASLLAAAAGKQPA